MSTLSRAIRKLDEAMAELSTELEEKLKAEVVRQSKKRGPKVTVTGVSAMGYYYIMWERVGVHIQHDVDAASLIRLFDKMRDTYGWGVIPAPFCVTCSDGKTAEIKRDW